MKKTIIVMCMVFVLVVSVGFVVAVKNQKLADEENPDSSRYLIKSDNGMLKMMYGVNHNFDTGFTTDLSPGQLKVLGRFGVEVEEVAVYTILVRPNCGDGICHPSEPLKCPEDCPVEPEPFCGDEVCNGDETSVTCPADCPVEPEPERICEPNAQKPWGIVKINGGTGGANVIVAVLDTGIDTNHPDLVENILTENCVAFGYTSCEDDNGHGTHVAGTILANGGEDGLGIFGVAPEAKIIAIKVLNSLGSGTVDDVAKGMRYAVDEGADIISMSLGGRESSLISDAVDYANENGVLVIAAAGNSGPRLGSILYPAANPNVVAVAAFDINNAIPRWSSRGINDGDWTIEEREIEFIAPGVSVLSTYNNGCYATGSGTSMAAPHVAGIAARDWTNTASETRTFLQNLAKNGFDYGQTGDDIEAGFGLPIAI